MIKDPKLLNSPNLGSAKAGDSPDVWVPWTFSSSRAAAEIVYEVGFSYDDVNMRARLAASAGQGGEMDN